MPRMYGFIFLTQARVVIFFAFWIMNMSSLATGGPRKQVSAMGWDVYWTHHEMSGSGNTADSPDPTCSALTSGWQHSQLPWLTIYRSQTRYTNYLFSCYTIMNKIIYRYLTHNVKLFLFSYTVGLKWKYVRQEKQGKRNRRYLERVKLIGKVWRLALSRLTNVSQCFVLFTTPLPWWFRSFTWHIYNQEHFL